MAEEVQPVTLKPETLDAFRQYIREAEAGMEATLDGEAFLWSDGSPKRLQRLRKGEITAEFWSGKGPVHVPAGLIHDWIGAAFIPGANLESTLARMQDYDNHKNIYKPEVIDSKLINRKGDHFHIFLRVLKKKIITVVLDTDHEVRYHSLSQCRAVCRSATTRVAEVDNAGKPDELVHPADTGYGFLWRINSYWLLEERDGGVFLECRAISLTRDVPFGLQWIIAPIVRTLPRESLMHTLKATRDALA